MPEEHQYFVKRSSIPTDKIDIYWVSKSEGLFLVGKSREPIKCSYTIRNLTESRSMVQISEVELALRLFC